MKSGDARVALIGFPSVGKVCTLKCLSIGTPKTTTFPFVPNEKMMVFRCPNIQAHYN